MGSDVKECTDTPKRRLFRRKRNSLSKYLTEDGKILEQAGFLDTSDSECCGGSGVYSYRAKEALMDILFEKYQAELLEKAKLYIAEQEQE